MREPIANKKFPLAVTLLAAIFLLLSCGEDLTDGGDHLTGPRINIHSGNNQTDRIGATLAKPLTVSVTNFFGDPWPGIVVSFSTEDADAQVSPPSTVSDAGGLASCTFRLGSVAGEQHVKAAIDEMSATFTLTAEEVSCPEEEPSRLRAWPAGHIFITTTSSTLLGGAGSVLIDFDPATDGITKVLETTETIHDLSFSSRGELFLTSAEKIFKVDTTTKQLVEFASYTGPLEVEIEPNAGGILSGVSSGGPFKVDCPPSGVVPVNLLGGLFFIKPVNLASHPVARDLFLVTGQTHPLYKVWKIPWDGRSTVSSAEFVANIQAGTAIPSGMCIDSTGTVYITLNGSLADRRIVSVSASGEVNMDFFDFYDYYNGNDTAAGQWGDIAWLEGKLYIIDTRNDRLVIISETGTLEREINDTAFSSSVPPEDERYGIVGLPE